MPDYLSKSEIAQELSDRGLGGKVQISRMLDGLAELASDELTDGNPFLIPGIALLDYDYRAPKKKGERWKKGDTVSGPMGESVKDSDSPPVTPRIRLKLSSRGLVSKNNKPTPKTMSSFLKSKAGKAVIKRKG